MALSVSQEGVSGNHLKHKNDLKFDRKPADTILSVDFRTIVVMVPRLSTNK